MGDGEGDGASVPVGLGDGVAVAVADALKATKLIFITAQDGLRHNDQLIRQMLVAELQKLLQQNATGFSPETLSKAQHAALACLAGIPRVHIINGKVDEGLLAEVFSNDGIGTLIWIRFFRFPPIIDAYNEQLRRARFFSPPGRIAGWWTPISASVS